MRGDFLDRYSRLQSPVHRAPAMLKAPFALGVMLLIVALPPTSPLPFAGIALLLLALLLASRVPPLFIAKRILLLEPFVIAVGALALLQTDGLVRFSWIALRSTLSLATVLLLSNTTPFADLLAVLRRLRVPAVFVNTLAMMYRYIFILSDEMLRTLRARRSRTFARRNARNWALLSSVLGQLFLRSAGRAERIYQAMIARGWQ
jgi:cobalt/nickel transport system permease protein